MYKLITGLAITCILAACSTTMPNEQSIPEKTSPKPQKRLSLKEANQYYLSLKARAQQDDITLDYAELRNAFSKSSFYKPYSSAEKEQVEAAFMLSGQEQHKECLETATNLLETNYISLGGHYISALCAKALNLSDKTYLNEEILEALFDSIIKSGDGKTTETAYITYTTEELYTFLQLNGLRVNTQNTLNKNHKVYNAMQVSSNNTEEFTLYFDITTQWEKSFIRRK